MSSSSAARAKDVLLRPFTLGGLTVPNRIVMAPMTREFSPGGVPGEDVAAYYARRAAGGVGLIITEGTYIGHDSAGSRDCVPRIHGEQALAGWAGVTNAVHSAGRRILSQLWRVGMDRRPGSPPVPAAPAMGPSGIAVEGTESGRAMTRTDIDDVVAAHATAAASAERIGLDGVEVHAGHGYLLLVPLADAGVDAFHCSTRRFHQPEFEGSDLNLAGWARSAMMAARAQVSPVITERSNSMIAGLAPVLLPRSLAAPICGASKAD
jgi:hypothetical protein